MPERASQPGRHRVVVVGGGFGGLGAVRAVRRTPVRVTLIDRRNFHLFQPLLYQVATGGLSPANIAAPLRSILRRQKNASVMLGDVVCQQLGKKGPGVFNVPGLLKIKVVRKPATKARKGISPFTGEEMSSRPSRPATS